MQNENKQTSSNGKHHEPGAVEPVPAGINWYVAIGLKACVRKKYPDVNLDIN